MSDLVIETTGLRKEFTSLRGGRRVAVQGLDLAVPAGGVHGFLGPNGSGKTTTIRMLLGLARATDGSMRLFGEPVPKLLPDVIDRVGAVVESPKFSPNFSGRQNLALLARSIGAPATRVDAAVETVGLTGRDKDRYKSYSLGMKQRLAIAATLLKDPDLLILDEPTNGLDPAGIREIRDTIRDLGSAGVTVLLSSHILAEVQQVCTSATIIGNGRMLASGRVDDLIGGAGTAYRVTADDPDAAARALGSAGFTVTVDERALRVDSPRPSADITRTLADAGIWLVRADPRPRRPRDRLPRADRRRDPGRTPMKLFAVELTRMRWRRAVILLVAACFLIPAIVWAGVAWNTRPVSAQEQAQVQAQVERDRNMPGAQREYRRCLRHPEEWGVDGDVEAGCEERALPNADWYASRSQISLEEERHGSGPAITVLLVVLLLLVGTTFVGHDWNSGSMSNQVLFESRRLRVWAAKGAAVLVTALAAGALVLAAYWGGLWLLAESRGIDTTAKTLHLVAGLSTRSVLLAAFAALGAYALTMLFRSTVATLGVLFAVAIVGPLLLAVIGFDGYQRWMPNNNFAAVLSNGYSYYDDTMANCVQPMGLEDGGGCAGGMVRLSLTDAAAYFAGLLLLAVIPSVWSFQRRDVP